MTRQEIGFSLGNDWGQCGAPKSEGENKAKMNNHFNTVQTCKVDKLTLITINFTAELIRFVRFKDFMSLERIYVYMYLFRCVCICLKGHSGFENGFLRALSTFGSSPNDTVHTN